MFLHLYEAALRQVFSPGSDVTFSVRTVHTRIDDDEAFCDLGVRRPCLLFFIR